MEYSDPHEPRRAIRNRGLRVPRARERRESSGKRRFSWLGVRGGSPAYSSRLPVCWPLASLAVVAASGRFCSWPIWDSLSLPPRSRSLPGVASTSAQLGRYSSEPSIVVGEGIRTPYLNLHTPLAKGSSSRVDCSSPIFADPMQGQQHQYPSSRRCPSTSSSSSSI